MSRLHSIGETERTRIAADVLRLLLAIVSVVVITYELAFVHQPRLGTSVLIYAIDAAFLFDIWSRRRSTNAERDTGWADPSRIYAVAMPAYGLLLLGNLPIDLLFFIGDGELWGISLVLWVRLFRVIRVGELSSALRRLEREDWFNTAALRIVRLVILVGLVVHLLACMWYLIPYVREFPADSWPVAEAIVGASPGYSYLLSLYWVVTVSTSVGFGDIVPGNTGEYVFALVTMIVGFSLFAYVVATGAALISSLNLSRVAFLSRVDSVESYLRSRRVDRSITEDVRRYYEYLWDQHGGFQQDTLLGDLPSPLRLAVLSDLLSELLPNVPVFRHSSPALRRELMLSLEPLVTQPGGFLVSDGDAADGIYFIARGTLEVVSADGGVVHGKLSTGDYFGDLTLLLGENRSASVRSVGFSEVFRLDAEAYQRIRSTYPDLRDVLMKASQERSSTVAQLVLDGIVL
jgi:CRP-like cAMP-binding protein